MLLNDTETPELVEDDNSSIDEPLDGANLLRRSLRNEIGPDVVTTASVNDKRALNRKQIMEYFVPSKWDAVDPQEVEAQAMSTEKMYYMELEARLNSSLEGERSESSSTDSAVFGRHGKWRGGKGKRKKSKDRDGGYSSYSKRSKSKKK